MVVVEEQTGVCLAFSYARACVTLELLAGEARRVDWKYRMMMPNDCNDV